MDKVVEVEIDEVVFPVERLPVVQKAIQISAPCLQERPSVLDGIAVVSVKRARGRNQACHGGKEPGRLAVGHDNARVRVDLEQLLDTQQVERRLEEPAHRANAAGLQKLQEALVPAKVLQLVGFVGEPVVVARQVSLGEILVTAEIERRDADAFLRRVSCHVVFLTQVRYETEHDFKLPADGVEAPVVPVGLRGRSRVG